MNSISGRENVPVMQGGFDAGAVLEGTSVRKQRSLARVATLALGALLCWHTSTVHAEGLDTPPEWAPGKALPTIHGGKLALGNKVMKAVWTVENGRLMPVAFEDLRGGSRVEGLGEAFSVSLKSGVLLKASDFRITGAPVVEMLEPVPDSAQLAARIPGRAITVRLQDDANRLAVVWRASLREGASYIRQEITLTALNTDCELSEVAFLNTHIPGAYQAGSVDGSPVVAGNFFLGYEDPMAANEVKTTIRPAGGWVAGDASIGRRREKTWPVDPQSLKSGTNRLRFRYERGAHRLDVWRVALLENGVEIARDEHHGRAGTDTSENVYSLIIPRLHRGATCQLVASLGTDPVLKEPDGGPADSFGTVEWVNADGPVVCGMRRNTMLRRGESLTQSFVVGVVPRGQLRRGFLGYVERERAHPYRPYLHYNSWYDTAWDPFALNETNCLEAIRICGERLIKPHGVVMDGMVFDDGWDNPKTLWQFHSGFPRGFTPLAEECAKYNTRLGVWLSPFGGYGVPKDERLKQGAAQGYEVNDTGFSLAGPKYYGAFKSACTGMIRNYGVNHFKFDGIATGMYANGGGQYILDTDAMRRLMLELRREDPGLYVNLTTGSWPSPFWLRHADSLWRQGGDMGLAGKGSNQRQWLTYRDQEVYRNVVVKGPLYPLNSLMTQGVAYSRHGTAGDPTFNPAGFKEDVRAFFGSGTGLQELYIQPGKLTAEDWAVLAEAAKWSRANNDVLVDTHWIGGDPSKLEVYGYASWSRRKGIVMLRNPDDKPHAFALDVGRAFELPTGAGRKFTLHSPWAEDAARPPVTTKSGRNLSLTLAPFEILILEAEPSNS